ncbi:MAG: DUF3604 domain-containing protein [Polyangiaceae bacterium]|nr:DUF3604 domain-containing protein [Polyangiaceae bacterium]
MYEGRTVLVSGLAAALVSIVAAGCGSRGSQAPEGGAAFLADPDPDPGPPVDTGAACPDANPLKNVYFGELHTHTSYSLDAYATGTRADPSVAYAFARGAEVPVAPGSPNPGGKTKIDRPLDFMAVTDHSEFLGPIGICTLDPKADGYDAPYCQAIRNTGSTAATVVTYGTLFRLIPKDPSDPILCNGTDARSERCRQQARTLWKRTQEAANAAYERCRFTTFKAYEWSGQSGMANMHRNVIFVGDKVPETPFDYIRYPSAIELWQALSRECKSSEGCDAITIPHNSNASTGQMWDTANDPRTRKFMKRYQVLVEFFQHKGNSECLPNQALGDPGCAFEVVPGSALSEMLGLPQMPGNSEEKNATGYVRNGLARGLAFTAQKQPNPMQFGFIGSTDTHNATPGNVKESAWPGHTGGTDSKPEARLASPNFNPGGIAAVWAEQNTRESIFAAMKRRETYATSGPRMVVRLYAASGVTDDEAAKKLCDDSMFPKALVDAGSVPMGGILTSKEKPYLFVHAMKDETPLERVEIVKLTTDASGKASVVIEKIAIPEDSGNRACVYWSDKSFDPAKPTLYYARVLEQPTWRWSHYDCEKAPSVEGCKEGGKLNVKVQERAWTSPIFLEL